MNFHIITIFPNIFDSYINESIIKLAQEKDLINIKTYNLRDWTTDKHKTVDDTPYGGGAGMLIKIEPLYGAVKSIKLKVKSGKTKTILLSAKGSTWNQQSAQKFSTDYTDIILICGRYEGVDERISNFIDEEISIGDFVLTGGEIGALTLIDSITRLIPGVLGNEESSISESHSKKNILEYPQYTRPEVFEVENKKYPVPSILLSGNHKNIEEWREKNKKTKIK
ncbi:MAG: tRNA (guanosine(37)-N1)-methyltransferase TrmD [Patescibacteria group bacterium]|jgi:tRNA (guanine37-N1)-methyltransferase|nr:tRNA (guanosine(37)-N1)-methyltransferase TrmD [Patescibacteria group bacterium]